MKPSDIRDEVWDWLRRRLVGRRWEVYEALRRAGPCTVRDLAQKIADGDPLQVAPRITELYQLGLVRLMTKRGRRGVYAAVPLEEAVTQLAHGAEQKEQGLEQGLLKLG